jgi:hypothetical protein
MKNPVATEEPNQVVTPEVEVYTAGACEPNPGPGGYGVVLLHPKKRTETSGGFRRTTNNRMEIYAAIKGLEVLCFLPKLPRDLRGRGGKTLH